MRPLAGLLVAYLLGSIPFALIAGKLLKGIDLRTLGSGNLGATNVYRTLGGPAAAAVLLLDAAKGAAPVAIFPRYATAAGGRDEIWWAIAFGIAAIIGHVRPIFLMGKGGGKGVATTAGVFLALAPWPALISIAVFVVVVATTRFVSVGSLAAAATLPLAMMLAVGRHSPLVVVSAGICLFVFWTHRTNIGRLRRGEESRLSRNKGGQP